MAADIGMDATTSLDEAFAEAMERHGPGREGGGAPVRALPAAAEHGAHGRRAAALPAGSARVTAWLAPPGARLNHFGPKHVVPRDRLVDRHASHRSPRAGRAARDARRVGRRGNGRRRRGAGWRSSTAKRGSARPLSCGGSATARRAGTRPLGRMRGAVHARTRSARSSTSPRRPAASSSPRRPGDASRTRSSRPSSAELRRRRPTRRRARGRPLGGRGDARRRCGSSGAGSRRCRPCVVATYRDDELDRAHPLRIAARRARAASRSPGSTLAPLSPAAVATWPRPHGIDAASCTERTGGNPFFVTEVLAAGGEQIPATVRDAVLARPRA